MTNGFSMARDVDVEGGRMGEGTTLVEGARDVLRRHATVTLTSAELRAGLRPLVRRARDAGATIEQLLVTFKRAWAQLPEAQGALHERAETTRRLERVVTLVIETYYEA